MIVDSIWSHGIVLHTGYLHTGYANHSETARWKDLKKKSRIEIANQSIKDDVHDDSGQFELKILM